VGGGSIPFILSCGLQLTKSHEYLEYCTACVDFGSYHEPFALTLLEDGTGDEAMDANSVIRS
jgi:hypothetical protein